MGLRAEVASSYLALIETGNIRYVSSPAAAAGIAMVSDGAAAAWAWAAYVEIIAAAAITDPSWLCGISIHTGVVETHYGEIAIASGAGAAEVDLAMFSYVAGIPTAVGGSVITPSFLPHTIKLIGQPRLAGRVRKDTAASAAGVTLKVALAEAIGT